MKYILYILGILTLLGIGFILFHFYTEEQLSNTENVPNNNAGGRDEQGCLSTAGYSFDKRVGACTRVLDLTPDIAEAARIAVEYVGAEDGLTVILFNSYEELGAYDIVLEHEKGQVRETIYIRGGQIVTIP